MSTCSTATSARRGRDADAGQLETPLRDLERDWDAYKTSRSGAPRHRRGRSATGTPSSAVTAAVPDDGLYAFLRCSPRRLVCSLQQHGDGSSTDSGSAITVVERGKSSASNDVRHEDDVCSVEAGFSVESAASCPCAPCHCAVLCSGCSTASSCTAAADSSFPPAAADIVTATAERAREADDRRWMDGGWSGRLAAIATAVAVAVIVAIAVLELAAEEGGAEFVVPT